MEFPLVSGWSALCLTYQPPKVCISSHWWSCHWGHDVKFVARSANFASRLSPWTLQSKILEFALVSRLNTLRQAWKPTNVHISHHWWAWHWGHDVKFVVRSTDFASCVSPWALQSKILGFPLVSRLNTLRQACQLPKAHI